MSASTNINWRALSFESIETKMAETEKELVELRLEVARINNNYGSMDQYLLYAKEVAQMSRSQLRKYAKAHNVKRGRNRADTVRNLEAAKLILA